MYTFIGFLSSSQLRYSFKFLMIYNPQSESYFVIWELSAWSCNIPHSIISILDSRFLRLIETLFSKAHSLRTLFILRLEKVLA